MSPFKELLEKDKSVSMRTSTSTQFSVRFFVDIIMNYNFQNNLLQFTASFSIFLFFLNLKKNFFFKLFILCFFFSKIFLHLQKYIYKIHLQNCSLKKYIFKRCIFKIAHSKNTHFKKYFLKAASSKNACFQNCLLKKIHFQNCTLI